MNKSQIGQGAIELILCINALVLFSAGTATAFYSLYSKVLINYQLQKAILCTEKFKTSTNTCKKTTSSFFKKNLWLHKKQNLKIKKGSNFTEAIFEFIFLNKKFKISKRIEISR